MRSILIVDDESAILSLLKSSLEMAGFVAYTAKSGAEALSLLDDHEMDALVTDLVMPVMNGTELIHEVRKKRPELAICYMTGFVPEPEALAPGIPVIGKPFQVFELVKILEQEIERVEVPRQ